MHSYKYLLSLDTRIYIYTTNKLPFFTQLFLKKSYKPRLLFLPHNEKITQSRITGQCTMRLPGIMGSSALEERSYLRLKGLSDWHALHPQTQCTPYDYLPVLPVLSSQIRHEI